MNDLIKTFVKKISVLDLQCTNLWFTVWFQVLSAECALAQAPEVRMWQGTAVSVSFLQQKVQNQEQSHTAYHHPLPQERLL